MSAKFVTLALPGGLSKADVEDAFYKAQDKARERNGHVGYSGDLAMATGIKFYPAVDIGGIIKDGQSAETVLQTNCEVWKHALAVRYLDGRDVRWLVGAWCAA